MGIGKSIAAIYIVLTVSAWPARAESPSAEDLKPNAKIEELLRKSPESESTVELKGYVGPSAPDMVRLYPSIGLSTYYEVPKSAIVGVTRDGHQPDAAVKLRVPGSATVIVSTSVSAGTAALASAKASAVGTVAKSGACDDVCRTCALQLLAPPLAADIYCAWCIACYATH